MPTTKYCDNSLSFLPSQQWTQQPHFPGNNHATVTPGAASSRDSSTSSSGSEASGVNNRSPMMSPDTTSTDDGNALYKPYLVMIEAPKESLRFRYPTEMKATHGSILGISTKKENARKKTFPSVKLINYNNNNKVILRCTLTTADDNIAERIAHVHQLKAKGKTHFNQEQSIEIDDPIDIKVDRPHYQAVFGNMTILYTKKDDQLNELVRKKKRHLQKLFTDSQKKIIFTAQDEEVLKECAQREIESLTLKKLNTACLKFEALEACEGEQYYREICPPLYSKCIKNMKSSQFNDLRICRISKVSGCCLGREEIFIFVDKVNKKDIKIRFYELDERGKEVWQADAEMSEDDVHFQYAIAFKTPTYRSTTITDNVMVYFQLERPSNGGRSSPKEFEYKPDPDRWRDEIRKRARRESPPIPLAVSQWDINLPTSSASGSSSSVPTWSEASSPMDNFTREGNIFNEYNDISELLKDFDIPLSDLEEMDVDPQRPNHLSTSTHSSLNDVLSNIPSGNSEIIKEMMNSETFSEYARCIGEKETDIQRIRAAVTTTSLYTTDGSVEMINKIPKCARGRLGDLGDQRPPVFATHQMSVHKVYHQEPLGDQRLPYEAKPEMFDPGVVYHSALEDQRPRIPVLLPPAQKKPGTQFTKENIVSKVSRLLNRIVSFKKHIKEDKMKCVLKAVFNTCVGNNNDRVLHVMASNQSCPLDLSRFLTILKNNGLAEIIVNRKNNEDQTALHVAVRKGSLETVALLLDFGADVNARDIHLNTPVHLVAYREQDAWDVLSHLVNKRPDLGIYNEDGLTALHLFVTKRKTAAVLGLIVKSESSSSSTNRDKMLNLPDRKQGNTALHLAVQGKYLDIVGLLLHLGDIVNVNAKNFEDKTPLAYVSGETIEDRIIEEVLLKNKAVPVFTSKSKEIDDIDDNEVIEDEVQEADDFDEDWSANWKMDWKTDGELKLLDRKIISPFCQVLDENENWRRIYNSLATRYPFQFEEDLIFQLKTRWSPTLHLLKFVAANIPSITKEDLRDILMTINADCRKAAQIIDDMILQNMGVF